MKALGVWKWGLGVVSWFSLTTGTAQQVTLLNSFSFAIKDYDVSAVTVVGHSLGTAECCELYPEGTRGIIHVACGAVPFQCNWWSLYGCGSFTAVSADGQAVVGYRTYNEGFGEQCPVAGTLAFRCTPQGLQILLDEGGPVPTDVSADGRVVVGYRGDSGVLFRWTQNGGLSYLPVQNACAGGQCREVFLSEDGQFVLGTAQAGGLRFAFRWNETAGLEYLGLVGLQADATAGVRAISADGAAAVGWARVGQEERPFYWTRTVGMRLLNIPAVSITVSADGSTVAGAYRTGGRLHAFRWTPAGGFQDLGLEIDPNHPDVYLSGTGDILVANGRNALYYWRHNQGVVNLYEPLCLYADASSLRALGLSRDGRYMLATGLLRWLNRSGIFRIDMAQPPSPRGYPVGDVNYDGAVDDADLLVALFNFGAAWQIEPLLDAFSDDQSVWEWIWWIERVSEDSHSIAYHLRNQNLYYPVFRDMQYFLNPHTLEWFPILGSERTCGRYCWNRILALSRGSAVLGMRFGYDPLTLEAVTSTNRFLVAEEVCQLPSHDPCRVVSALADNGTVAVGWNTSSDGAYESPFRWTVSGGLQSFPTLGGVGTYSYDISSDGTVVVGGSRTAWGALHAFVWSEATGIQSLGTLGGNESSALKVSDDGRVVYGWTEMSSGAKRLFRWTAATGMRNLGLPWPQAQIRFMTADGSVIAGVLDIGDLRWVFRWSEVGGLQILGAPGGERAELTGMSADGLTLAGAARMPDGSYRAFLWTPATGFLELGECREPLWDIPQGEMGRTWNTRMVHLSQDGRVVVWQAPDGRIFYRRANQVLELSNHPLLQVRGVQQLHNVHGVSADGTSLIVVGTRTAPDGGSRYSLMVITPPFGDANMDGVVDDADLLIILFNFGASCRE